MWWDGRARHPSVLGGSALVGSSSSGSNSSEVLGERVQVAGTSSGVPLRRREWMPPAKCSADSTSSGLFVFCFFLYSAFHSICALYPIIVSRISSPEHPMRANSASFLCKREGCPVLPHRHMQAFVSFAIKFFPEIFPGEFYLTYRYGFHLTSAGKRRG